MAEEDLIYGKNRHMFGGAEPSNMIEFSARINENSKIEITAKPPKDTIIDGQTLCSVAGAIIRRKSGNYPKDEFDGTLVTTVTEDVTFTDAEADQAETWYYSAFPYSIQGVYNRNPINRCMVNEPEKLTKFVATYKFDSLKDKITVTLNVNFTENVHGVTIRKSTTGYLSNENDGELLSTIYSPGDVADENVESGIKYFYSAFPFTSTGEYNRDPFNRVSVTPRKASYYFGYDLDMDNSNPDTRVTYPGDVDNANFEPAGLTNISSSGTFALNDWDFSAGEKFMPRPCTLSYDGMVVDYLNPSDFSKTIDGEESNIVGISSTDLVMMEWPKIYTKRWKEGNIYKFRCSDAKLDDDFECWCNYDIDNNEIEHFYMSAYRCYFYENKVYSRSGTRPDTYTFLPTLKYILNTLSTILGEDWSSETIAERTLISDLLVMMAKNTNIRNKFGCGTTSSSSFDNGINDANGMFVVKYDHIDKPNKIFGLDAYWGSSIVNVGSTLTGIMAVKGGYNPYPFYNFSYKTTPGTKDGSKGRGFSVNVEDYKQIAFENVTIGYGRSFTVVDGVRLISDTTGASSTTYDCCYIGQSVSNEESPGGFSAGSSNDPYKSSPYSMTFIFDTSSNNSPYGSSTFRLSFRPKAK